MQIDCPGAWTVEIRSAHSARLIEPGGEPVTGVGADVLAISGTPDIATVIGNGDERYFGIEAVSTGFDNIVSTTDPFDGQAIVPRDALFLIVDTSSSEEWSIHLAAA